MNSLNYINASYKIAFELYEILVDLGLEEYAPEVLDVLRTALIYAGEYGDDAADVISAIIALKNGTAGIVDIFWQFAEKYGTADSLHNIDNQLIAWRDTIANADDKAVAAEAVLREMGEYAVLAGILTADEVEEIFDKIEEYKNKAQQCINCIIDRIAELGNIAESTLEKLMELKDKIDVNPAYIIDQLLDMAYNTAVTIDVDDTYLALGGETASGEGIGRNDSIYFDILEEEWGITSVNNASESPLSAEDILECTR